MSEPKKPRKAQPDKADKLQELVPPGRERVNRKRQRKHTVDGLGKVETTTN
jgi:hypothetical protein